MRFSRPWQLFLTALRCLTRDDAVATAKALDKAAGVYVAARAATAGSDRFAGALSAEQLLAWAKAHGVNVDESLLA